MGLLNGENVKLTRFHEEDLTTLEAWYHDEDFMRLMDATPAFPASSAELRDDWLAKHKEFKDYVFAVRTIKEKKLIGFLVLDDIDWANRNAWIALGIGDKANWNQGYGQEIIQLGLGFAFRELNLHRVQLTVFGDNKRAIAAYEKCGFVYEGTQREYLWRDGRPQDMLLYGILHAEWKEAKKVAK